jgi:hypothetical protein
VEERVALLEDALNKVQAEAGAAVRTEAGERAAALEAERQARESSDSAMLEGIKKEVLRKHPQKEVECLVRWIFV